MATYKIFDRIETTPGSSKETSFQVWVTDGLLQFVIDGEIRHDIDSVEDFLIETAKILNKNNNEDGSIVESVGSISDNALENYEGGKGPVLDSNGTNPSISLQDDGTEVKIANGGVGGSFRVDFGTGAQAEAEAGAFNAFAQDLLGKATVTQQEVLTGIQIGDYSRTVTVSTRDDDVRQIKFKSTGDAKDLSWADIYIDDLAEQFGGWKLGNGNVSDLGYTANQINIRDDVKVSLGAQGVGGSELFEFADNATAQAFLDTVKADFTGDRRAIINEAIEIIADGLGGTQIKNGNVSTSYKANQIKLIGADKDIVDLGSQGVGGKERYEFDDQATAQQFIDQVRDAVGVEAREGSLVDEFVYKVSGGAGISGSPTFVGKDDFVAFIAEEFGGDMKKNGSVSESFAGGGRIVGDGTDVQLGPKGVGGKEIWDFEDAATANAFIGTLDDIFG
ncbi:hypothetical protein ACFORG_14465 [Lutimaribacter marinistellae]|uniref:Uncharacterized protein n=1 Tax=Lutimaribacter marinistellae TaxID=1820329 RepID=A0ABV7THA1_9RHOB